MAAQLDLADIKARAAAARAKSKLDHDVMMDIFSLIDEILRMRESLKSITSALGDEREKLERRAMIAVHLAEQALHHTQPSKR